MNRPVDVGAVRREVATWLEDNWDDTLTVGEWWSRLADSGWGFPTWPSKWFGRDLPDAAANAVAEEFVRVGALGPPNGPGAMMAAPMLLTYGTEEQKHRWIPALANGEEFWCQFYSEPAAGSDLASVRTRAERTGDEWVVNGQKVWNSGTNVSDRALLVARTNVDVPKHAGITIFVLDLAASGIDIRPIQQMNGHAEFYEAFLTDVRVADADRVGDTDKGWGPTTAVLAHERRAFAGGGETAVWRINGGRKHGDLDLVIADLLAKSEPESLGNLLAIGTIDALIQLARRHGRLADPTVRQRIAGLHALSEALRLTGERIEAEESAGRGSGADSSILHLGGVRTVRLYRDLIADIAGPAGMLWGTDVSSTIATAPAHGLQGGTEQIQKNVIGERILGLPREPQVDRDVPFAQLLAAFPSVGRTARTR